MLSSEFEDGDLLLGRLYVRKYDWNLDKLEPVWTRATTWE